MASTLVQRIVKPLESQERIPVHAFIAGVMEFRRGNFTANQLFTAFALSAAEQTDATSVNSKITANTYSVIDVWMWLLLGQSGYLTVAQTNSRLQL